MELQIKPFSIPEVIEGNFEELKQEITRKASDYETLVYTDEQIPEAKKDRAALNKFVDALENERKRIKKECLKPYENIEPKFKELVGIVNRAITNIDGQVKGVEENKKKKKKKEIQEYFNSLVFPDWVTFEMIFDEKWLNSSVTMKSVQTQIQETLAKIEQDLATLSNLTEFGFEAIEVYKQSLNLSKAIQEGQRLAEIQKRKREAEEEAARRKAEQEFAKHMNPPVEEPKSETPVEPIPQETPEWVSFQAYMTTSQALQLKNFFDCRGIEFKPIAI